MLLLSSSKFLISGIVFHFSELTLWFVYISEEKIYLLEYLARVQKYFYYNNTPKITKKEFSKINI